ncbi:MSMEG_6728 family protein [Streptomyces carpaticus]|uniref:Uncharacterized protein n=2 Tax=Streptomyces TaxID=1883 RepID=A0A1I6TGV1_9ACTN|nr:MULTISPECIES: MSMEG_6728 family protein [Streptomyces]QKV69473.1 MSMEG_6728 family protein [Streptomyces harbinensis]UWM49869.1 MSMEG_6728 family protein [Streptomyces carpaticus]SFS88415.1 hypothetical protein SAMN05444716_104647 [Streptomyces harbinensis]
MQTFLPFPDFAATARTLDTRRLGKQRVEALQVLRGLVVPGYGWRRHPAVRMWTGYEEALTRYGLDICHEWCAVGHADTCRSLLRRELRTGTGIDGPRSQPELAAAGELPPWLGDPAFHRSHQSALLRKNPEHYSQTFPGVRDDLPYVWPASDRTRSAPSQG